MVKFTGLGRNESASNGAWSRCIMVSIAVLAMAMSRTTIVLLCSSMVLSSLEFSTAFIVPTTTKIPTTVQRRETHTITTAALSISDDSSYNRNMEEREDEGVKNSKDSQYYETQPRSQQRRPPLTTVGKQRLEIEIRLLESLADSDAAIEELVSLWNSGNALMEAELLVTIGHQKQILFQKNDDDESQTAAYSYWKQAETILQGLINSSDHDSSVIEPIYKLGYLYALQKKYSKATEMYKRVLKQKEWHLGAIRGMVVASQAMDNTIETKYWSSKCLPPLPMFVTWLDEQQGNQLDMQQQRRKEWVDDMVSKANQELEERSEANTKQKLENDGSSLFYYQSLSSESKSSFKSTLSSSVYNDIDIDDCWQ